MFVQDTSRELDISNVSHFLQATVKGTHKKLSFVGKIPKKIFVNLIQIYPFWRLKDHWLCQPSALPATIITQNLGMNILSSS